MADLNLIHRVRLPDPNTGALFPAVVMVHGWQGDENVMWVFERTLPQNVVALSPRGPVAAEGSYGWFADRVDATDLDSGLEALREFVTRLPEVYPVDGTRITLMGFSQGAAMCYALMLNQPGLVKGLAALAGFLPQPAQAWIRPGRLAGKPVFIAHGLE
ncbi:MAG: alpha/beta hydrolase, partial [Anaerolineales bacterium]